MKTIKPNDAVKEDLSFLFNVVFIDFFRVAWVYLIVYLLAVIFL